MKQKAITLLIVLALLVSPVAVFADDDICYDNLIAYDEWYNPISYGSHSWGYDYTEDASCESDGYEVHSCSYCGQTKRNIIPATGHNWSDPDFIEDPDRYDTLILGTECENEDCDEVQYVPVHIKKGKQKKLFTKKELKALRSNTSVWIYSSCTRMWMKSISPVQRSASTVSCDPTCQQCFQHRQDPCDEKF